MGFKRKVVGFFTDRGKVRPVTAPGPMKKSSVAYARYAWLQRPIYFVRDGVLHRGLWRKSTGEISKSLPIQKQTVVGEYRTGCPNLFPAKAAQRAELVQEVKDGVALETHGGKGNLSEKVYAKSDLDKTILIDEDKKALGLADKKLDGKIKHEVICMDNLDWLKTEMNPDELKNLKVVDFDPFGSPADSMTAFFDRFPVEKTMFIGVTDGSKRYLGYVDGAEGRRWLKEHYGIDLKAAREKADEQAVKLAK